MYFQKTNAANDYKSNALVFYDKTYLSICLLHFKL